MNRTYLTLAFCAIVLVATCTHARAYQQNAQPMFGTYSQKYLDKQEQKQVRRVRANRCRR